MKRESESERLLRLPAIPPAQARRVLPLSRNAVYEAIKRGDIVSVRIGKKIVIPTAPLRRKLGLVG